MHWQGRGAPSLYRTSSNMCAQMVGLGGFFLNRQLGGPAPDKQGALEDDGGHV